MYPNLDKTSASLRARAGGPVQADRNSIFLGGKFNFCLCHVMFVGVMNFGQVQKIRFFVVKIFWSNSNKFLVILIRSSKLASFYFTQH